MASGATRFGDPKGFPRTMGWQSTYQTEGLIDAQHILKNKPDAKIGIPMQNDDFGKDNLKGFLDRLSDNAKRLIVAQATSDPTWKGVKEFENCKGFMTKYHPAGDVGCSSAQTLDHVLHTAGDNRTRENIMKSAASMSLALPMLCPGIDIKTSPDDFYPIERMQMVRFDGTH